MRRLWTTAEISLAGEMYPHCHTADIAAWLERTVSSIYGLAGISGWHKSPEYLASDTACRVRRGKQHPSMIASRFKQGLTPWNKGVSWDSGGRSHETRFAKGQRPKNEMPLGSYRISKDGYLERKETELPGPNNVRWFPVHRMVWESAHGPIPSGHVVTFKDGRRTSVLVEITVERLECISRGELAKRNHPRARSPELAKLVQLKGAITRQVNRIARETQDAQSAH